MNKNIKPYFVILGVITILVGSYVMREHWIIPKNIEAMVNEPFTLKERQTANIPEINTTLTLHEFIPGCDGEQYCDFPGPHQIFEVNIDGTSLQNPYWFKAGEEYFSLRFGIQSPTFTIVSIEDECNSKVDTQMDPAQSRCWRIWGDRFNAPELCENIPITGNLRFACFQEVES